MTNARTRSGPTALPSSTVPTLVCRADLRATVNEFNRLDVSKGGETNQKADQQEIFWHRWDALHTIISTGVARSDDDALAMLLIARSEFETAHDELAGHYEQNLPVDATVLRKLCKMLLIARRAMDTGTIWLSRHASASADEIGVGHLVRDDEKPAFGKART